VCVREREREREREFRGRVGVCMRLRSCVRVYVCTCVREYVCVGVYMCVCVSEREREREEESVCFIVSHTRNTTPLCRGSRFAHTRVCVRVCAFVCERESPTYM